MQDRWMMGRITLNLGLRYDQFIGETRESKVLPNRFTFSELANGVTYGECPDGKAGRGLLRRSPELEGHLAARRLRDGRLRQRPYRGQGERRALCRRPERGSRAQINPVEALSRSDPRPWTNDIDRNGFPLDANGNIQFNELGTSTSTSTFGRNVSTTRYDPEVLNGWFKRGYNLEWTVAAQHQLADRDLAQRRVLSPHLRQPDVHRRPGVRRRRLRFAVHQRTGRSPAAIWQRAAGIRSAACRISSPPWWRRAVRPTT